MAPFATDMDFTGTDGCALWEVVEHNSKAGKRESSQNEIYRRVKKIIQENADASFEPIYTVLFTWYNASPYTSYRYSYRYRTYYWDRTAEVSVIVSDPSDFIAFSRLARPR